MFPCERLSCACSIGVSGQSVDALVKAKDGGCVNACVKKPGADVRPGGDVGVVLVQ